MSSELKFGKNDSVVNDLTVTPRKKTAIFVEREVEERMVPRETSRLSLINKQLRKTPHFPCLLAGYMSSVLPTVGIGDPRRSPCTFARACGCDQMRARCRHPGSFLLRSPRAKKYLPLDPTSTSCLLTIRGLRHRLVDRRGGITRRRAGGPQG